MTTSKWESRPSALSNPDYPTISVPALFSCYQNDSLRLHSDPCALALQLQPPRYPSSGILIRDSFSSPSVVRICQWNINCLFYAQKTIRDETEAAHAVAQVLLETNADVIVLNEYGERNTDHMLLANNDTATTGSAVRVLNRLLETSGGYEVHVADTEYPTAVATRLPIVQPVTKFFLDDMGLRAAVRVRVQLPTQNEGTDGEGSDHKQNKTVCIYGTHLEDSDRNNGILRLQGMTRLLKEIAKDDDQQQQNNSTSSDAGVFIVGDLNQQRERDYHSTEWQRICANKQRRASPQNDGVAAALERDGFQCNYDKIVKGETMVNWNVEDPPPSTHWTGTVIDYCYGRGSDNNLRAAGVYVSPCGLSDHRLIVTDWAT